MALAFNKSVELHVIEVQFWFRREWEAPWWSNRHGRRCQVGDLIMIELTEGIIDHMLYLLCLMKGM
jgi:hypothetical protein